MHIIGTLLTVLGSGILIYAGILSGQYWIFNRRKERTDRISAVLLKAKQKKNVPVFGRRFRVRMTLENVTKGLYEYKVGGKAYRIRCTQHVTAKQMPRFVMVIYWKRFPRIAYIRTHDVVGLYHFFALIAAVLGLPFLLLGLLCFLR